MSRHLCFIPARMNSSRYPGKPLEPLLGMPMILHTYHRCRLSGAFERVVVATCDDEIAETVQGAGGEAVMTSDRHERATDRVSEAVQVLELGLAPDDFVLMVQGDEVLFGPDTLTQMIETYESTHSPVVNLASRLRDERDVADVNTVKVVAAPDGRAIYFSRAPIPSTARVDDAPHYQQTGIIGFSAEFLERFSELEPTPLEQIESCDMMRVIEHNLPIQIVRTEHETIGVDTPDDLRRAEQRLAGDPVTRLYLGDERKARSG